MGFNRAAPAPRPSSDVLTARMAGIGMNFATKSDHNADIEATLVDASSLGMDDGDLRVLSVVTTWVGVHHTHVNADRLIRLVKLHESHRVHAYWAAISSWLAKDRRFAHHQDLPPGPGGAGYPALLDPLRRGPGARAGVTACGLLPPR